jgi:Flp pilus assembly protein TadD
MWMFLLLLWADPASLDNALRAGLEALQRHDLPVARARLEQAARIAPGNAKVWLGLAQTYWKLHLSDLAQSAAAKAQQAEPEDPLVLHSLAYFYAETGDPAKAAPFEAQYANKTPGDPEAYSRAVDLYLQASQPKPAIELARAALTREDRANLHDLLGEAYEMDSQPARAASEIERAIQLDRYNESYYFDLGRLYLRNDNPAAAARTFENSAKIFAKSPQLELARGVAYYALRRFADAAGCFLRTIEIAPQIEQPYIFLGRMLDQVEDQLPQITAAYAAFVKAHPDSYLANFLYAKALSIEPADPRPIEALLRKSITLNGQFWESHYQLGILLERQRDFDSAAAEFRRAIECNAQDPAPHYHLARVYERLGKQAEAAAEHAAHERLSGAEGAAKRRQETGLTYRDLPAK